MMGRALLRFIAFAVAILAVFPLYWALSGSLLPPNRIFESPARYLPLPPVVESYVRVFYAPGFMRSAWNSAVVAGLATLLSLAAGSLSACALARFRMRGGRVLTWMILGMTMFPQITVVGAIHATVSGLGLYNTLAGLIVSYQLLTLPFTVWVLASFFRSVPREIEESAYVDGASPFVTYWRILLPLVAPGIVTAGLLVFITAWNEYLFALSLTLTDSARTVPVAIANFAGDTAHEAPWGPIMAAAVLVTLPLVTLVLLFQRRIVEGLTAGAVKA
jgi:trehalose/maltose transport system permease protein